MNKLSFIWLVLLLAAYGCHFQKGNNSSVITPTDSSTRPGSDRDQHGCIASAGYTWSQIKKECIRIWEAGDRFTAYGDNTDSTLAAYLVTTSDVISAEVFLPGQKGSILLNTTNGSTDQKTMMRIYQSQDSSTYVIFFPSPSRYVLYVDKKPMFACPHPLK